jgi:carbon-monoxide dehydrogenase medium subunit
MKPAPFEYYAPSSLEEALDKLAELGYGGKVLAGGQSLIPAMNFRMAQPAALVDLNNIPELFYIKPAADGGLMIGTMTRAAAVEHDPLVAQKYPFIIENMPHIAHPQIRNRGTVGGSLAHADPAADWPLAIAALDGVLHVAGPKGRRTLKADAYMVAAYTTALADDEIIEGVEVPKLSAGARWGYYKFCRKTGEFPDASAAVVIDPARRVSRVFIGALDTAPKSCAALAAQIAQSGKWSAEDCDKAVATVAPDLDNIERATRAGALARALQQVLPQ